MAADIWALGILLYEMAHSNPPFNVDDEDGKIDMISNCEQQQFEYKAGISDEFKDLVERILRSEPRDRLTFDDIFQHEWIQLYSNKLNIDVERIRYKDSLFGKYGQDEID